MEIGIMFLTRCDMAKGKTSMKQAAKGVAKAALANAIGATPSMARAVAKAQNSGPSGHATSSATSNPRRAEGSNLQMSKKSVQRAAQKSDLQRTYQNMMREAKSAPKSGTSQKEAMSRAMNSVASSGSNNTSQASISSKKKKIYSR